ncbi:SAPS family protein [Skeletonema marinoi]|uniref:SAPS family protein n=1 Tax=Skeletonema marinoi TaxID=267567 RepID=A0AAD9D775_9STRA|nr:SAPS family protein [Skeletonema marinoi]
MHILQRLLVPSPLRQQGTSKGNSANKNDGSDDDVAASKSTTDSDDDENPYSAPNNDFMNAINQMNGNQQMSLHDMDDEDVDDEDDLENDLTHLFQCDWSERPDCVLAYYWIEYGFPVGYSNDDSSQECDVENDEDDAAFLCSQHAAEILVTIIQNSSLNSSVMISLSSDPALKRVLDIASLSRSASFSNESKDEQPEFVPYESKMTCAITVLESLVLQLGGYGAVGVEGANWAAHASTTGFTAYASFFSRSIYGRHVISGQPSPCTAQGVVFAIDSSRNKNVAHSAQYTGGQPRLLLGTSRLRILRLVEALVLLGDASVDFDLQHSNILKHCIDLFWEFEWCSMLHQSVANFLVHVFEGGEGRSGLQEYFLEKCQLMERLMDSFGGEDIIVDVVESGSHEKAEQDDDSDDGNSSKKSTDIDAVAPVSEEDVDSAMEQCMNDDESSQPLDSKPIQGTSSVASGGKESKQIRKGYMGHVIIICQALAHASTNTGDDCNNMEGDESNAVETQATSPLPKLHSSPNQQETPVAKASRPSQISLIIQRDPLLFDKWEQFVASTLAFEMSVQSAPLGDQPMNNGQVVTATSDSQNQLTAVINDTSDDFLGEPSGHLIFGGSGAAEGDIDMDEIDLDIADSMMENLSLPSSNGESDDSQLRGRNRRRAPSKESNLGHNFGSVIPTTTGFKDYIYDDPLGGGNPFDNEDENDKHLDKGSEDEDIMSDAMVCCYNS